MAPGWCKSPFHVGELAIQARWVFDPKWTSKHGRVVHGIITSAASTVYSQLPYLIPWARWMRQVILGLIFGGEPGCLFMMYIESPSNLGGDPLATSLTNGIDIGCWELDTLVIPQSMKWDCCSSDTK